MILRLTALATLLIMLSCGVKTPPLPPLPETAQKSDREAGKQELLEDKLKRQKLEKQKKKKKKK